MKALAVVAFLIQPTLSFAGSCDIYVTNAVETDLLSPSGRGDGWTNGDRLRLGKLNTWLESDRFLEVQLLDVLTYEEIAQNLKARGYQVQRAKNSVIVPAGAQWITLKRRSSHEYYPGSSLLVIESEIITIEEPGHVADVFILEPGRDADSAGYYFNKLAETASIEELSKFPQTEQALAQLTKPLTTKVEFPIYTRHADYTPEDMRPEQTYTGASVPYDPEEYKSFARAQIAQNRGPDAFQKVHVRLAAPPARAREALLNAISQMPACDGKK